MTAEEWKIRAEKRYIEKAALPARLAVELAEAIWQQFVEDGANSEETPEAWVDEDLTYWTD